MARKNATGLTAFFTGTCYLVGGAGMLLLLGACSSLPGLDSGQFTVEPVANLFKPDGRVKLFDGATPSLSNSLGRDLKLSNRETDPGMTIYFGDGFSGLDFTYDQHRRKNSNGDLVNSFGSISGGSTESDLDYTGVRLAYVAQLYGYDFPSAVALGTDYEMTPHIQAGLGLGMHQVGFDLAVFSLGDLVTQEIEASGMVPFAMSRIQLNLDKLKLRWDQSFSGGDWGDMTGTYLDTKVTLRFEAATNVDILLGIRRLTTAAEGTTSGNDYELNTQFTGWILGFYIVF